MIKLCVSTLMMLLAGVCHADTQVSENKATDTMTMVQDARCRQVLVNCEMNGVPMRMMLDTGAGMLELFANAPDELSAGALRHMAFAVEDTDACIEAVRAAGYQITMEPTDIVIASEPPYPARIAFCIGPVGEEVEFFHVK